MLKLHKRMIAVLLTITMILSVIVVAPFSVSAKNSIKTQAEAVAWLNSQNGATYNLDTSTSGTQCVEFVKAYVNWLINGDPWKDAWGRGTGNAKDIWANSLWAELDWDVYQNTASFVPQPGDIFVVRGYYSEYGHTGVVISSDVNNAVLAESNVDDTSGSGTPVRIRNKTWTGIYTPTYFIRPKFSTGTPIDKPGKPSLTSNKSVYPYGETVTLSWGNTANATNYWLDFYKDGVKIDGRSVSSPLVLTGLEPGKYAAYITATNAIGQTTSNACNFEVFNSAPGKPQLTSNKSACPYGDDLTLSWDATMYATNYWLDFYKDGVKVDGRLVSSPLVLTDLEPGEYAAYITATNPFGQTTSNVCTFEVFNSAPGKPHITLSKSEYLRGEDVTLTWDEPMYSNNYWLDFYKDGVKVDGRSVSSPLVFTDLEPGKYAVYITANNLFGHTTSDVCNFEVKDDESELPLYGDANDDGDVNIQDATIVQMVVAKYPVEKINEKLADYDQNGEINIRDATSIQMIVAKLV